jgi:hypothetical protein
VLAQENADWQRAETISSSLGLTSETVFAAFWNALQWAQDVSRGA